MKNATIMEKSSEWREKVERYIHSLEQDHRAMKEALEEAREKAHHRWVALPLKETLPYAQIADDIDLALSSLLVKP